MKINLDLPINSILRNFVEEIIRRHEEDLQLIEYLEDFIKKPYRDSECRGIDQIIDHLERARYQYEPLDRSCLEPPEIDTDDNDNIPF